MEATIEEVIKDINMSLPERKLKQLIERTSLSADVKAIMSDIVQVTIKVGGKVLAIGAPLAAFVGPFLLAIGVTAGALKDFTNDKLQDRITALVESFKVLVAL